MTIEATQNASDVASAERELGTIHPLWVRITHWINALAVFMMIGSGWQIYDASPLFSFSFPPAIALGNWLAGALLWHFAAMWLLVANGLVYLTLGLMSGRLRRKLLPIRSGEVIADARAALTFHLAHQDPSLYNALQKLLYVGVILCGAVVVLSGLSIWKPVQLQQLTSLFGGYDTARYVHFFAMAAITLFIVIHVIMALVVPSRLRAMVIGR